MRAIDNTTGRFRGYRRFRGVRRIMLLGIVGLFGFLGISPTEAYALQDLTYQHHELTFPLKSYKMQHWKESETVYLYEGTEIIVDDEENVPEGVHKGIRETWNPLAIAATIEEEISSVVNRAKGIVRIEKDEEGTIIFKGVGLPGRTLDSRLTAELTIQALEEGAKVIQLPITEEPPEVIVADSELRQLGIRELVTIGESDYSGSPANRKHNIATGLATFNGSLTLQGEEFSFNEILGPVDATTGYKPELTIMGEKTLPEYGGGLCQVSTTAYRGVWRAGLPITKRRNHSYAVRYYAPSGTDATIYPPHTDMKFKNDTDGALLIQTYAAADRAYFIYYGTKPKDRSIELIGPFTWGNTPPPPDRVEYTTNIPNGTTRVVSERVPGMKTMWYRKIAMHASPGSAEEENLEPFYSHYESRPFYQEIGVDVIPSDEEPNLSFDRIGAIEEMKNYKPEPHPREENPRWSLDRVRVRRE